MGKTGRRDLGDHAMHKYNQMMPAHGCAHVMTSVLYKALAVPYQFGSC